MRMRYLTFYAAYSRKRRRRTESSREQQPVGCLQISKLLAPGGTTIWGGTQLFSLIALTQGPRAPANCVFIKLQSKN